MNPDTATGDIVAAVSNVVTVFKKAMADGKLSLREKLGLLSSVMGESDALARAGEIDDELKAALKSPAVLRELLADVENSVPETGTLTETRLEALADFLPHCLTFYQRITGKPLDIAPVAVAVSHDGWSQYKRRGLSEMRPYEDGEPLDGVSISQADKDNGSPMVGDMIARNPANHADQWLVAKAYFEANLEPA